MAESKFDRVERLMRALHVREEELKAARDAERRAAFRLESLEAAVRDLRETIRRLVEEDVQVDERQIDDAEHEPPSAAPAGTIAQRILAYLDTERRSVEANEIGQALGVSVDVIRTTLSKLFARGAVARPKVGMYRSLLTEHEHRSRGARGPGGK